MAGNAQTLRQMQEIREKREKPKRQDFVRTEETKFLTLFNVWRNRRVQWNTTTAIFWQTN